MIEQLKLRTKKKIYFMDLVRPETLNPYMSTIGPQEAFGVLQWMVREGKGVSGLYEALSGKPTCINFSKIEPFSANWKSELVDRFRTLLFSNFCSPATKAWKMDHNILITESKIVSFLHYGQDIYIWMSNSDLVDLINKTFDVKDKITIKKYNPSHPRATSAHKLELMVMPTTFSLDLVYGYPKDSSYWNNRFSSKEGEPFLDFIKRANEHYHRTLR